MCRSTASVIARDEYSDDGEEIVSEFGFGRLEFGDAVSAACCLVVNHEFAPGVLEHALDEVEGESTQSVAVGHHNLLDVAVHDAVQNGREACALPVDAGADVLDDLVVWVLAAEQFDLSLKVLFLLGAGDAGVAHFRALVSELLFGEHFESGDDIVEVVLFVQALALTALESDRIDATFVRPALKRPVADLKPFSDLGSGDVFRCAWDRVVSCIHPNTPGVLWMLNPCFVRAFKSIANNILLWAVSVLCFLLIACAYQIVCDNRRKSRCCGITNERTRSDQNAHEAHKKTEKNVFGVTRERPGLSFARATTVAKK